MRQSPTQLPREEDRRHKHAATLVVVVETTVNFQTGFPTNSANYSNIRVVVVAVAVDVAVAVHQERQKERQPAEERIQK